MNDELEVMSDEFFEQDVFAKIINIGEGVSSFYKENKV
ncbi:MAG: hypothetical protein ACJAT4_000917 [Granulosicoccus sp.]|jgi:hypothetical protein